MWPAYCAPAVLLIFVLTRQATREGPLAFKILPFQGVCFCIMSNLSNKQKAEIINAFDAHHYDVQFRGPEYLIDALVSRHHKHDTQKWY